MAALLLCFFVVNTLILCAKSLFLPLKEDNGKVVRSVLDSHISLSYKETQICETTPGVKSYAGYVHLETDPSAGRTYDANTFFWFFEARKDPHKAPLSVWLQGGPGAPSIPAAVGENGPCHVGKDSKSTVLNPWSWNNEVNMLYFDQPVQVGFSYDSLINGTIEESVSPFVVTPINKTAPPPELNSTFIAGIFSSQNPTAAPNTTVGAAEAAWHFMQTWIQEFPQYKPRANKFSIWSESYGGHYGPTFSDYFESQNKLIADGTITESAVPLRLDTVGIVNGCIDILTQIPTYPELAFNNTYGIQAINESVYQAAVDSFPACRENVETCRSLSDEYDPQLVGNNATVNKICKGAFDLCFSTMWSGYSASGRNVFDITAKYPDPFPPKKAAGYLNTKEVQDALGVPLNFTGYSAVVNAGYTTTGDFVLGKNLDILGQLVDRGVKVALVYGDRDYECNWLGGERISLSIKSGISEDFRKAGYANIETNATNIGGAVRQKGNLSFSRVYGAGHEASWYQPEAAWHIFNRVMHDLDVAKGKTFSGAGSSYVTEGPQSVFAVKNELPTHPHPECYFWDIMETCTPTQTRQFRNRTAITEDFIMVGYLLDNGTEIYYDTQGH